MAAINPVRLIAVLACMAMMGCTVEVHDGPVSSGPSAAPVHRPPPPPQPKPAPPPRPVNTTVPTVTGMHQDRATTQINTVGLRVGRVTEESSLKPNRVVLRQSPGAGASPSRAAHIVSQMSVPRHDHGP